MKRRAFLKLAGVIVAGLAMGSPSLAIETVPIRRLLLCDLNAIFAADAARLAKAFYA